MDGRDATDDDIGDNLMSKRLLNILVVVTLT